MTTLQTAVLTLLAAFLLAFAGPALDAIPDHHAERDQAAELEHAQRQAQIIQRFERAAQKVCGPQAAWQLLADGVTVQCRTKYGRKTITAQVQL